MRPSCQPAAPHHEARGRQQPMLSAMNAQTILLLAASALFAWSMGSHYTGAVMGGAYGAGVLSARRAQLLGAGFAIIGSVTASLNVIDTYANGLVVPHSRVDIAAAQLSAALVTTASTYFKLPTSTIQIYAFSLLGVALVGGIPIHAQGFEFVVLGWAAGPVIAALLGYMLAKFGLGWARKGQPVLKWLLIGASIYSAFTLGSNDVSNAASSLVAAHLLSPRLAGLWGGVFMAFGVLTWGRKLLERIGRDILKLDVPLAATAQFSQAAVVTVLNVVGYNASINQTIVGGLAGAGLAAAPDKLDRSMLRKIVLNWVWSPLMGTSSAALACWLLRMTFR